MPCERGACRAMDAPSADYSRRIGMGDRYVKLTNQVAEIVVRELPSKLIVFLAYSATALPPPTTRLHPNILPVITTSNPALPTTNAFEAWDRWMRTGARHMGLYLHHMCVQRYWIGEQLRTAPVRSDADAPRVVEDARRIFALSRNIRDHVMSVLEKPPVDAYRLFRDLLPAPAHYERLKSGDPPPESPVAIDAGIRAVTEFLREQLGPDRAAAWWQGVRQAERVPYLFGAFDAARMHARMLLGGRLLHREVPVIGGG